MILTLRICVVYAIFWGQLQPSLLMGQQPAPLSIRLLKVRVLEGSGAINNPQTGYASPIVVEVRDQDDRPVEGAEVTFTLPVSGPGGTFGGKEYTAKTVSNYQGQALATGFRPNSQMGSYQIEVTATFGALKGQAVIAQQNSDKIVTGEPKKSGKKKWIFIGAGAAGAVTAFLLLRGGDTTISLSPGPATIGVPR